MKFRKIRFPKKQYIENIKNLSPAELRKALVREAERRFAAEQTLTALSDHVQAEIGRLRRPRR